MTHPLLGGCTLQWSLVLGYTCNEASKLKMLHKNGNQYSMIRVVYILHIDTKRNPLTNAGNPNILVHMMATFDDFQSVLDFLCHYALGRVHDVHACVDVFTAYRGMIRGCTENIVIWCILVIKHIIFCCDHL